MGIASTSFGIASLFGYLAQFFSERANNQKATEQATIDEYLEWLRRNNHQEVVTLITDNADLSASIKTLLSQQHQTVIEMLKKIDAVVGSVAAGIEILRPIAESRPFADSQLSDSSIDIIQWLTREQFSGFLVVPARGDDITLVALGRRSADFNAPPPQTNHDVLEPQFFEDDIATMLELGVLRETFNGKGDSLYHLTRGGSKLAKSLAPPAANADEAN